MAKFKINPVLIIALIGIIIGVWYFTQSEQQTVRRFIFDGTDFYEINSQGQTIISTPGFPSGTIDKGDQLEIQVRWRNDYGHTVGGITADLWLLDYSCRNDALGCSDIYYDDDEHDYNDISAGSTRYLTYYIDTLDFEIDACGEKIIPFVELYPDGEETERFISDNYFTFNCDVCESHYSKQCWDALGQYWQGDVYWYNSCGDREEVYLSCGSRMCVNSGSTAYCEDISYDEGDLLQTC